MNSEQNNHQLIVVSASAGSGKTRALALRYLDLLLNPKYALRVGYEQILAITFTKKATHEMKERILNYLKAIAIGPEDPASRELLEELGGELGFDLKAAAPRAAARLEELVRKFNFFQVQTIDSFINSLIFACSLNLNLDASIQVEKNFEEMLRFSLDEVIDQAATSKELLKIFRLFLKQYLYVENKAAWYPKEEIYRKVKELFEKINLYGHHFILPVKETDLVKSGQLILKQLRRLLGLLPEGVNRSFVGSLQKLVENEEYFYLKNNGQDFLKKEKIPLNKGVRPSLAANRLWRQIRQQIRALAEREARQRFTPYLKIFQAVATSLEKLKKKENLIFLAELNRMAQEIFSSGVSVPEIYYRLATRFNHYLIDEFQDTSVLEWHNLLPLIEEALATGGSLFYVGDKKQSIYRFRGAEATLFDRIPLELTAYLSEPEVLNHNFRSYQEIIDFNNALFSEANLNRLVLKIAEEQELALKPDLVREIFRDAPQLIGKKTGAGKGYLEVKFVDFSNQDERDELVKAALIPLIQDLTRRGCPEVAILCRENQDVELVSSWLLENKIQVASEKTLNIRENPLVKEIISFLKFLNSPIDNLAFASFVSGQIFSRSSSLAPPAISDLIFEGHFSKENQESAYLYKNFQARYRSIWQELFEEFFKNVGFLNLYELIISILKKFRVSENFAEYQVYFLKLLELVKNNEDQKNDLAGFLEYWAKIPEEELFLKVSVEGAVKVLTIHKAKGLQFEVVILPFGELSPKVSREGVILQKENGTLELLQLRRIYLDFSSELEKYYLLEYQKSLIDELNSFYVAFTRAKSELYVFVPKKAGNQKNFAWFFLADEPNDFKRGRPVVFEKEPAEKIGFKFSSANYQNWLEFVKEEFPAAESLAYRSAREQGEILHYILARIIKIDKEFEKNLKVALDEVQEKFGAAANLQQCEAIVRQISQSKKSGQFFKTGAEEIFTELEVVSENGATFRIDRLIVGKSEVQIVDFKSSADSQESHEAQLKNYAAIVQQLYPDKKVRGFLIYFDSFEIEEVNVIPAKAGI